MRSAVVRSAVVRSAVVHSAVVDMYVVNINIFIDFFALGKNNEWYKTDKLSSTWLLDRLVENI